mmetsp:Transcript_81479/g.226606  ORF Transcript_81479/g.226606 Transcript_81479/m.226606 type:complete len:188 (-) Transcript_81479:91-654(-)
MARAIATRCCWPPLNWLGRWPARWAMPRRSITSATRSRRARAGRSPYSSARPMFSATVRSSIRLKLWNTKPMRPRRRVLSRRSLQPATFWPSNQYSPALGASSRPRRPSSVDLPQPEGPVMARYSPASMSRSRRSSAVVSMSPLRKVLVRCLRVNMVIGDPGQRRRQRRGKERRRPARRVAGRRGFR